MTNPGEILKQYWGYDQFRGLQSSIVNAALNGNDTLGLMPTGGGKSICFQVPGMMKEGITIVISPLIALMIDQVENLQKRGIKAVAIYTGMTYREIDVALDNCVYGNTKFLYVSPERTTSTIFRERLKKMNVSFLVVDEAHCISQWGHDFRPSYLKIKELKEFLKTEAPTIALTATANKLVQKDIVEQLELNKAQVFKQSFYRENLGYLVFQEQNKEERLVQILTKSKGTSIVYVSTRKKTVDIAKLLKSKGFSADYYHGGLNQQTRAKKQQEWINNKTRVMIATNAFGMGIDKPDVRVVVHLDLPQSPEAYFQEAGRAGRDGQRAYATILYQESDKLDLLNMHELSFPEMDQIRKIYNALGNYFQLAIGSGEGESFIFNIGEFGTRYNLKPIIIYNSLKLLEANEYLSLSEAIYHPTTVKALVSAKDLYEYQVKNKSFDLVLRVLMRNQPGIFDSYKKIDLSALSKETQKSIKELDEILTKLTKLELIDYVPSHDSPLLTFLVPRVNEKTIRLSKETYQDRKNITLNQINTMITYCETEHICRSRILLSYFDESDFKNCGICDACIENKRTSLNNSDFEEISEVIKQKLSSNKLTLKELVYNSSVDEQKAIKVVQFLLDNSIIKYNSNGFLELN